MPLRHYITKLKIDFTTLRIIQVTRITSLSTLLAAPVGGNGFVTLRSMALMATRRWSSFRTPRYTVPQAPCQNRNYCTSVSATKITRLCRFLMYSHSTIRYGRARTNLAAMWLYPLIKLRGQNYKPLACNPACLTSTGKTGNGYQNKQNTIQSYSYVVY